MAIPLAIAEENTPVTVRWVADGDTIILHDDRHVRYIGIDTPEIDHQNHRAAPFGYEARAINRQLVEGGRLYLILDREKTDHYGRTLAYVYRSDGLFINAELIRQGYAHVLYSFPNTTKTEVLLAAQREAMIGRRGIWQSNDKNEKSRHAYRGNRRSKRFHTHDCPMGKKMVDANQIWFDREWDAFWAGYAPARECIPFPTTQ